MIGQKIGLALPREYWAGEPEPYASIRQIASDAIDRFAESDPHHEPNVPEVVRAALHDLLQAAD